MDWAHATAPAIAAFLASLVEFVEAFTIVLAVGSVRGWRSAMAGSAAAVVVLFAMVLALGPALERFPLTALQQGIGLLLLLFGMRWLRKSALRAGHVIPLRDEAMAFSAEASSLGKHTNDHATLDTTAFLAAFNGVLLEGVEVVFIVIAVGAVRHALLPAALGAVTAGTVVVSLGVALRTPLTRIPENALKFVVGVLLSAFGTFWIGEGLRYPWPYGDLSIIGLAVGFLAAATLAAALAQWTGPRDPPSPEATAIP